MNRHNLIWSLIGSCAGLMISAFSAAGTQAPGAQDLTAFLDKAAQKIKSYSENASWTASAVSKTTKMDKNWTPESVTVVTKTVKLSDGDREEVILKAEETKKGKTKDVTEKYVEEANASREKGRKRRAEQQTGGGGDSRRSVGISLDSLLPFSEQKRGQFEFKLTENADLEGRPAILLDVAAKVKDEKNWEGRFYFDPATDDLLGIEVRPSENPSMVKELEFRMTFEILEGRYLAVKSSRVKVNGGFFLKHIRQVIEEEYSGFEVLKR
jgi:hypothetical protein